MCDALPKQHLATEQDVPDVSWLCDKRSYLAGLRRSMYWLGAVLVGRCSVCLTGRLNPIPCSKAMLSASFVLHMFLIGLFHIGKGALCI